MSDIKCGCEKITGVNCDVDNCRYHSSDNCCEASCIKVESPSAMRKGETFCSTFEAKASV
jgi:hypothetical protein